MAFLRAVSLTVYQFASINKKVERANFRPDAQCFPCKKLKKQRRANAKFQLWQLKRKLFEAVYLHEHPDEEYLIVK